MKKSKTIKTIPIEITTHYLKKDRAEWNVWAYFLVKGRCYEDFSWGFPHYMRLEEVKAAVKEKKRVIIRRYRLTGNF